MCNNIRKTLPRFFVDAYEWRGGVNFRVCKTSYRVRDKQQRDSHGRPVIIAHGYDWENINEIKRLLNDENVRRARCCCPCHQP
jgi:hypothetical protein